MDEANGYIEVRDIKRILNTRTDVGDTSELMLDIEHRGLINPIEVYKDDDGKYIVADGNTRFAAVLGLGWNKLKIGTEVKLIDRLDRMEHLERNLAENIHRKELSPIEVGKVVNELLLSGMNKSGVSAKLHKSIDYINRCYMLYKDVPLKYRKDIGEVKGNTNKGGKIPMTLSERISKLARANGLSKEDIETLYASVKKDEITGNDLAIICNLVKEGAEIETAIRLRNKYKVVTFYIVIDVSEKKKAEELHKKPLRRLMAESLMTGEPRFRKELFFKVGNR